MTDDQLAAQPPPLQPLHRDGVAEFGLGTVVFAVASAVLYFGRDSLGVPAWWVPMALTGLVIGLIATAYCVWRRNKRARDAANGIATTTA